MWTESGALKGGGGGVPCRLSVLRNGNIAYMSLSLIHAHVACERHYRNVTIYVSTSSRMSLDLMSPVDFRKKMCRPVEFQGGGP